MTFADTPSSPPESPPQWESVKHASDFLAQSTSKKKAGKRSSAEHYLIQSFDSAQGGDKSLIGAVLAGRRRRLSASALDELKRNPVLQALVMM